MTVGMIVVSCLIGVLVGMQIAVARAVFGLERYMHGVKTASELTLSAVNRIEDMVKDPFVAIDWTTLFETTEE